MTTDGFNCYSRFQYKFLEHLIAICNHTLMHVGEPIQNNLVNNWFLGLYNVFLPSIR